MNNNENNSAFIDGANLHKGIISSGWKLDYKRLRKWLSEKYSVAQAYIFMGNIPKYSNLYTYLQESGYTLVFKEVVYDGKGKPKGNCDTDLVLKATQEFYENKYDNAVIIASDGDYSSLVSFLNDNNKLEVILSPANQKKCSILLKRTGAKISYLNDQQSNLKL